MNNPHPQQPRPLAHPVQPGTRVRYTPADGSRPPVGATVDGVSAAPDRPLRYHILVDGERDYRQVDESELSALAEEEEGEVSA